MTYQTIKLKIFDPRLDQDIPLPDYATAGSSGLDSHARLTEVVSSRSQRRLTFGLAAKTLTEPAI